VKEVKEAIWNCESSKSLGPDGVTFNFIKKYWSYLKRTCKVQYNISIDKGKYQKDVMLHS